MEEKGKPEQGLEFFQACQRRLGQPLSAKCR